MAKKKAAKKKKTAKELSQAHGKVVEFQPTTLDQIWGDTGTSKYNTVDVDEYRAHLNDLARSDLQAHAVTVGLIPVDNAETLKKRLVVEFNKHVSQYRVPAQAKKRGKALSKKMLKILEEGK